MKKVFLIMIAIAFCAGKANSQETSVEKSLWGIQIGVPPLAIYQESRLSNSIALRTELNFGFSYSYSMGQSTWAITPTICVEPRYYYNLEKRSKKGKITAGNSGNFLSLSCGYTPGVAIKSSNADVDPSFFFIPNWGIKRNIGTSFNYEIAVGIGYGVTFDEYTNYYTGKTYKNDNHGVAYSIRLAIGYKF